MLKEEAIDILFGCIEAHSEEENEALDMAIEALQTPPITQRSMYQKGYAQGREEALKRERTDEWCTDCKEYDTEKKCCPRFNKVIREAMKRVPHDDGTLEVKVEDATKVGRVLISDDKHRGGLYYPDEDEPQGDLISRADAMMEARPEYLNPEQIGHEEYNKGWSDAISMYWANLNALPAKTQDRPTDGDFISRADAIEAMGEEPPVWCDEEYEIAERDQWRADIEAIKSVPSADRPTDGDLISRQAATSIPIIPKEHRKVFRGEDDAFETGWNEALACVNMLPSAGRPRGEWVSKKELIDAINDMEVVYDGDEDEHKEHDISKLVRVMFKDIIDNLPSADMRGDTE